MAFMRSQARIMRTTALFAALVETEWLQRQCLPLLTRAEAVLVVLVTVEAGFESLRRDKSAFPPLSAEALVRLAAQHGRWRVVQQLQRSCRPVKHPFYIDLGDEEALGPIGDVDFAQCLWIQRHYPLAFAASVVYAAVRRGCLEQVKWLDRFVEYDVNLAIPIAAEAGQVDVLQWLLDNQKPIKKHFWFPPPRFEVVMRRADTFLDGINWFDTKTQVTNCFLVGYGLLPPTKPGSSHRRYPFMDWAAERGDLPLLQRLHEDPDLKRTCSYCAMQSAAERGDLEMIQWLHATRREHRNLMVHVLQKAAEHGHVHVLAWLEANGLMPRSSASIFRETARAGQVEALRWLFGHLDDAALHPPELTYYAARSGCVDMVKYIHEELDLAVTSQGVYSAAQKGHDEVVQWLLEHDQEQVFSTDDYYDTLLKAAADNGNLLLVKKCVEEYGAWSRDAAEPAITKGHVSILDYLHSKALEGATSAGTSLEDEISYSSVDLPAMLKSGKCDDIVLWVLKHTSEEDQLDKLDDISRLVAQNVPSWDFTRQYMLLRPKQSRNIRLLPRRAIQLGSLSDLQTLEAMQHPRLFTKRTLRYLLVHTRDDVMVNWFVSRCASASLGFHLLAWAAKYGDVALLLPTVEKLLTLGEQPAKVLGTVTWSATMNDQVIVLAWLHQQAYLNDLPQQVWRFSLAERAARRGLLRSLLWLHKHQKVNRQQMDLLAGIAAQCGQIRCLKGLYDTLRVECSYADVVKAGRRGFLDVVECILRQQPALRSVREEDNREVDRLHHDYKLFMARIHTVNIF